MDLSTTYLGLTLENPLVAGASPLSRTLDGVRALEDAGAAAVVMFSLFEEQVDAEDRWVQDTTAAGRDFLDALRYYPATKTARYGVGPDEYLDLVSLAKRSLNIPVIGSLNGATPGGWVRYARLIEGAGADALELNLYSLPVSGTLTAHDVETQYLEVVQAIRQSVTCPVAVKIGPYFSALANMAYRFAEAGANALVLFNRFYQPDFDLDTGNPSARAVLSRSEDLRSALRWVALLSGRVSVDFAVTGGVHTHEDVLKAMLAGANVAQVASELLEHGPGRLREILADVTRWLEAHEQPALAPLKGRRSLAGIADPAAWERTSYADLLERSYPPPPAAT